MSHTPWFRSRIAAALASLPLTGLSAGADAGDDEKASRMLCSLYDGGRSEVWCTTPVKARPVSKVTAKKEGQCPGELDPDKLRDWRQHFRHVEVEGEDGARVKLVLLTGTTKIATEVCGQGRCCYTVSGLVDRYNDSGAGRLLVDGEHQTAPLRRGRDWHAEGDFAQVLGGDLSPRARALVAQHWLDGAVLEHAGVPSFARATLELISLGAPPDLVAGSQQASIDEIHHARYCFAIAAAYGGEPFTPDLLPVPGPRRGDFADLARWTFEESCVPETLAVAGALASRQGAEVPICVWTLDEIIRDESEHAALGWSTIAWAIEKGGEPVREAVREAAQAHRAQFDVEGEDVDEGLAAHGLPAVADLRRATSWGWDHMVLPLLADLGV